MNELRCRVLVVGRRSGRLCRRDPRRPARPRHNPCRRPIGLGGTCLNVGCHSLESVIHAAGAAHGLREPRGLNAIGLSIEPPKLDYARTIAWKDSLVSRLTNGVGAL